MTRDEPAAEALPALLWWLLHGDQTGEAPLNPDAVAQRAVAVAYVIARRDLLRGKRVSRLASDLSIPADALLALVRESASRFGLPLSDLAEDMRRASVQRKRKTDTAARA